MFNCSFTYIILLFVSYVIIFFRSWVMSSICLVQYESFNVSIFHNACNISFLSPSHTPEQTRTSTTTTSYTLSKSFHSSYIIKLPSTQTTYEIPLICKWNHSTVFIYYILFSYIHPPLLYYLRNIYWTKHVQLLRQTLRDLLK